MGGRNKNGELGVHQRVSVAIKDGLFEFGIVLGRIKVGKMEGRGTVLTSCYALLFLAFLLYWRYCSEHH